MGKGVEGVPLFRVWANDGGGRLGSGCSQMPQLTIQDCTVQTPQGQDYVGKCYAGKQVHMARSEIAVAAGIRGYGVRGIQIAAYSACLPH